MKKYITILSIIFLHVQLGNACTFIPKSFCDTAMEFPDNLIVSGYITAVDTDGINFEILEILAGTETRTNIRIWDGTDFDCNGIFSMAASDFGVIDDTLILNLPLIVSIENTWDNIGDYRRPNNYEYSPVLHVSEGGANGFIKGYVWDYDLSIFEFDFDLFTQYWIEDSGCDNIVNTNEESKFLDVKIFPNPTSNLINIQMEDLKSDMQIEVVDPFTQKVVVAPCYLNCTTIGVQDLVDGFYILRIRQGTRIMYSGKFIKV